MPSLGNLFVEIGAKTDKLDSSLQKTEKGLLHTDIQMRKLVNSAGLLAAGTALAGAALVASLVQKGRIAIDSQAKLAQALDGTIGGLRALEMAAGDAGISESELSTSMSMLNRRLGEAQKGSGAAYDALNRLGLSAENLSSLDIDERMAVLADRVKTLGLTSSQAAFEMRELGIRNENMANMMRQGGDAIRAQAEEVKNLGLNLSMVDAAQVELANDALGVFGDVMTGIQDRLTVTAAPYITEISERFREAALESGGFKDEIESTINTIIKGFGKAGDAIQGLRVVFAGIKVVVGGLIAGLISGIEMVAEVWATQMSFIVKGINKVIGGLQALGVEVDKLPDPSKSDFMEGVRLMGDVARDRVVQLKDEMKNLATQELPSSKIDKFLADVAEKSKKTAEQVVSARTKILGGDSDYNPGKADDDKAAEEAQKKQQAELEAIKNRYLTEEELNRQHKEMMAVIGEEFNAANFETEEQWRSIKEQAELDHMQRLHDIVSDGYSGIQSIANSHWGKVGAQTAGAMQSIIGTMAAGSKKAFDISKSWAMADALISTFQGIAAGVRLGWPMGIPAVAWAAANGFAQVSAIKNQSFGGAGGAAASGGGTPAQAPNPVGVGGGQQEQQSGGTYRFEGLSAGSFVSSDMVVEMLKQAQKDGAFRGQVQFSA